MITLVEALDSRCLRYVHRPLDAMHVEAAIAERTRNFSDLTWGRKGSRFELAIEAHIPAELRALLGEQSADLAVIRYEVACGLDPQTGSKFPRGSSPTARSVCSR